jgi:amidohydrolase
MLHRQRLTMLLSAAWLAVPALAAQQADPKLLAALDRQAPAAIELRRQIHQNPELGNREVQTAALIADKLKALGLEVRTGDRSHRGGGHPEGRPPSRQRRACHPANVAPPS